MPRKQKKLITWIVDCLNAGKFEWVDEVAMIFLLPWPRQKCKKWIEDASWFVIEYIRMQGDYRDGDRKQYVKWKARLRTALNKEKSLKKIKEISQEGFKIFQLLELPKGVKIIPRRHEEAIPNVDEIYRLADDEELILPDISVNMNDDSGIDSPSSYGSDMTFFECYNDLACDLVLNNFNCSVIDIGELVLK